MIRIVHYIADFVWIFGGLFLTLLGFNVIKIKTIKPEDQEKREQWQQKNAKLMKILGIVFIVLGIFKLTILIFDL